MDNSKDNNIKNGSAIIGIGRGREAKIDYELYGDDNAPIKLLLVMGFLQPGSAWKLQRDYFIKNKDFQICLYDNRGINNSTSFSLSTKEMAEDAVELLEHLKWSKDINICGASLGGSIVTHICNIIPDKINSAIISAPHLGVFTPLLSEGQKKYVKSFFIKEEREKFQTIFSILFSENHLNSPSLSDPSKTKGQAMVDRAIKNKDKVQQPSIKTFLSHFSIYLSTRFSRKDLKSLYNNNVNILVFGGEKDALIPIQNTKRDFIDKINKNFKIFNTGHCINLEKPNEFNELVLNHIINSNNNNNNNKKNNINLNHINNNNLSNLNLLSQLSILNIIYSSTTRLPFILLSVLS